MVLQPDVDKRNQRDEHRKPLREHCGLHVKCAYLLWECHSEDSLTFWKTRLCVQVSMHPECAEKTPWCMCWQKAAACSQSKVNSSNNDQIQKSITHVFKSWINRQASSFIWEWAFCSEDSNIFSQLAPRRSRTAAARRNVSGGSNDANIHTSVKPHLLPQGASSVFLCKSNIFFAGGHSCIYGIGDVQSWEDLLLLLPANRHEQRVWLHLKENSLKWC